MNEKIKNAITKIKQVVSNIYNLPYGKFIIGGVAIVFASILIIILSTTEKDEEKPLNMVYAQKLGASKYGDVVYTGTVSEDGLPDGSGLINIKDEENGINVTIEGTFKNGNFIEGMFIYEDKEKNLLVKNNGAFESNMLVSGTSYIEDEHLRITRTGYFENFLLTGDGIKSITNDGILVENIGGYFIDDFVEEK